jgi:uncharacterized membrane protein
MSSVNEARTIGGIGAILVVLSFVPAIGALFGLVGFIMILVAVKYLADGLNERKIFTNIMVAVILAIAGIAVGSIVVLGTVLSAFANGYFGTAYPYTPSASVTTAQWITFGTSIGLGLLGAWVFLLVSAVYLRRSYKLIGSMLQVGMFGTAGTLYLVGAATAVVGIGFLILPVAQILTAVAFWSIPPQAKKEKVEAPIVAPVPQSA